jgi:hypothetical protein
MFTFFGHFEFRHFRPHFGIFLILMSIPYLAIWGVNVYISVVSIVVRNTIFRKAPPSVVFGYGERSINLNKVVVTFEKHTFLSHTDLTRTGIISNSYNEMFEAQREPPTIGKQLVNFITCDCESSAPFFVIYTAVLVIGLHELLGNPTT